MNKREEILTHVTKALCKIVLDLEERVENLENIKYKQLKTYEENTIN